MSQPRFSVVIPAYNRAHLLRETLDSVLCQSWRDFEIVVVDDGSTDDTAAVLDDYRDRVRSFHQANGGVAAARNRGIREAEGEIVAFLDSDDLWEPHTLERVAATFGQHPDVGLVSWMGQVIDADGRPTDKIYRKPTPGPHYSTRDLLWGGRCSWFAVRRRFLFEVGLFDEGLRSAEECDLALRLSFRTRLFCLREPLLLRRLHPGNLSADRGLNARLWLRILDKLAREQPEFVAAEPRAYRRARGKEHLRLGRELLRSYGGDPVVLEEARGHLGASVREWPWFFRAWSYLAWGLLAPRSFSNRKGAQAPRAR